MVWTRYERRSKVQRVTEAEIIVMWARCSKIKRARVVLSYVGREGQPARDKGHRGGQSKDHPIYSGIHNGVFVHVMVIGTVRHSSAVRSPL